MRIVQMSDIHVGTEMFRPDLLEAVIQETNAYEPDLVAVVGDLTTSAGTGASSRRRRATWTAWSVRTSS